LIDIKSRDIVLAAWAAAIDVFFWAADSARARIYFSRICARYATIFLIRP